MYGTAAISRFIDLSRILRVVFSGRTIDQHFIHSYGDVSILTINWGGGGGGVIKD
jgi:hypothetical protein